MLSRINIYLKEMYPIIPRLMVSLLLVAVQYFGVLAFAQGDPTYQFSWADIGVIYTVFAFLMLLRIADEFKDLENDLIIKGSASEPIMKDIHAYFQRLWNNEDGIFTEPYENHINTFTPALKVTYWLQKLTGFTTY